MITEEGLELEKRRNFGISENKGKYNKLKRNG